MKINGRSGRSFLPLIFILTFLCLTGCGKRDAGLDEYKTEMESYFSSVAEINYEMNSIDLSAVTTDEEMNQKYSELLGYLDQLNSLTDQMAGYEVPEQFSLVDSLADETAENMSSAVELYHQLYEGQGYDQGIADAAYEYYDRANTRIHYIKSILQGNIPDELDVEYYEDEE